MSPHEALLQRKHDLSVLERRLTDNEREELRAINARLSFVYDENGEIQLTVDGDLFTR